jgi:1,2-diacylglycerol 3-alpha-glucosyltransferase
MVKKIERVGIITSSYPPNLSGISVVTKNLVTKLQKKGLEVFVATPKIDNYEYSSNVLPVKSFNPPDFIAGNDIRFSWFDNKEVFDFFKKNKAQIIHTQEVFMGSLEGQKIANQLDIPCVHTYHTFWEKYLNSYGFLFLPIAFLAKHFSRIICNRFDKVITVSKKLNTYLEKIGVEKDLLINIENVQDLSHLYPKPKNKILMKKYGLSENDFVILSFSRISKEKGYDTALEILAPLIQKDLKIKYLICGTGPYIENLKIKARKLKIEKNIIFVGRYEQSELASLCSLGDIYLNTAEAENQPTVILEAMSCGLASICIFDNAFDYILKDGENGFKTKKENIAEKILELKNDSKLRQKISKEARKSAEEVNNRDVAGEYIKVYESLV